MHRRAFTIIWLAIALIMICVIAGAAIPQYFKSRSAARQQACASNRRVLDDAEQVAMLQTWLSHSDGMDIDDLVPEYLSKLPRCDEGGSYALNGRREPSSCSIHGDEPGNLQLDRAGGGNPPGLTLR